MTQVTDRTLHPMIGMNLLEQEEWFNDRIQGIFDTEPPISCNNIDEPGKSWISNVVQFKPRKINEL